MAKKKKKLKLDKAELFIIPLIVFAIVFLGSVLVILLVRGMPPREVAVKPQDSPQEFDFVESVSGESSIPEDFPPDFPVYPDSTLKDSWVSESSAVKAMSVVWMTDRDSQDVFNFYRSELQALNWEVIRDFSTEDSQVISFEKKNMYGHVAIAKDPQLNTISVTIGIKYEN